MQAAVGLPTMSVGGTSYAGDGADVPECAVPSWGLDLRTIVGIRDANHVAIRTPAYGYPYRTQDQSAWQSAVSRAFAEAAFLV
ncbi:hypothetical protein, partial [Clostridioides difficile]|uniref:hypothetical protein n=1 Tax=Clostridioides difficile TaxID=1496 RepID=UPI001A9B0F39